MKAAAANRMQQVQSLPPHPESLIRDEVALPGRYQPCDWARDLVAEWNAGDELRAAGAYPTLSVLLTGPSGVGKTTAARWVAYRLGRPCFSLLLSGTIDSYLGATGKSIENAVRYATKVRCVLVLDELDAVAAARNSRHDVGEIWRVTNTFIQVLDHWHGQERGSLIVGTTNMAETIDPAIRRRFELEVPMGLPTAQELSHIAGVPVPDGLGLSHAAMRRAVLQARRRSVLKGGDYRQTLMAIITGNGHGGSQAVDRG